MNNEDKYQKQMTAMSHASLDKWIPIWVYNIQQNLPLVWDAIDNNIPYRASDSINFIDKGRDRRRFFIAGSGPSLSAFARPIKDFNGVLISCSSNSSFFAYNGRYPDITLVTDGSYGCFRELITSRVFEHETILVCATHVDQTVPRLFEPRKRFFFISVPNLQKASVAGRVYGKIIISANSPLDEGITQFGTVLGQELSLPGLYKLVGNLPNDYQIFLAGADECYSYGIKTDFHRVDEYFDTTTGWKKMERDSTLQRHLKDNKIRKFRGHYTTAQMLRYAQSIMYLWASARIPIWLGQPKRSILNIPSIPFKHFMKDNKYPFDEIASRWQEWHSDLQKFIKEDPQGLVG